MRVHAQSFSGSTSHLPSFVPPHGPFSMPLWQRVTGQMAPVMSRMQSPQRRHFSSNCPTRITLPRKRESFAGKQGFSVASRVDWTPAPHPMHRMASAFATSSLCARNSFLTSSSWQPVSMTTLPVTSLPSAVSFSDISLIWSSPPVWATVAQSPQPTRKTLLASSSSLRIASKAFCFVTIICSSYGFLLYLLVDVIAQVRRDVGRLARTDQDLPVGKLFIELARNLRHVSGDDY